MFNELLQLKGPLAIDLNYVLSTNSVEDWYKIAGLGPTAEAEVRLIDFSETIFVNDSQQSVGINKN